MTTADLCTGTKIGLSEGSGTERTCNYSVNVFVFSLWFRRIGTSEIAKVAICPLNSPNAGAPLFLPPGLSGAPGLMELWAWQD